MKTKIIPFDLETAKKIQAGEIKGRIKTRGGEIVDDLHVFSTKQAYCLYASIGEARVMHSYTADGYERKWDKSNIWLGDLVLEVPDNEPQFKPFDRVLVRDVDQQKWACSIFSHLNKGQGGTVYYNSNGLSWNQCIPYEGNEDLVGTTNEPKEE